MFAGRFVVRVVGGVAWVLANACVVGDDASRLHERASGDAARMAPVLPIARATSPATSSPGASEEAPITATPPDSTTTGDAALALANGCGWGTTSESEVKYGYVCDGSGGDPRGEWARACPEATLAIGEPCGEITGVGCCDGDGNVWYCVDPDGTGRAELRRDACS